MDTMFLKEVLQDVQGEAANQEARIQALEAKVKTLMDELQGRTQPADFPPAFDPAEQGRRLEESQRVESCLGVHPSGS